MKFASDKQSSSDPRSRLLVLERQGQTQHTKYLLYTFCIHTIVEGFTVIFKTITHWKFIIGFLESISRHE